MLNLPGISVENKLKIAAIICTYNREKYIRKVLDSLTRQQLPITDFEIVVVNNNSTDRSEEEILRFRQAHPELNFTYVTETNQGLSFARNRGVVESRADLVTFLDDDALATEDFLQKCVDYFERKPELLAIGGKIIPEFVDGKPIWYTRYYWGVTGQFDLGDQAFRILYKGKFPCGSNMTFRRGFFDTYGFFNTNLGRKGAILLAGEEKELFSRVKSSQERDRVWYFPDLQVYHMVDNTKLNPAYLEKFCYGFAKGEKLEIAPLPFIKKLKRYVEFTAKSAGTLLLGCMYLLRGQTAKASMIVRFGWWIFYGFYFRR